MKKYLRQIILLSIAIIVDFYLYFHPNILSFKSDVRIFENTFLNILSKIFIFTTYILEVSFGVILLYVIINAIPTILFGEEKL